jgi:hypothetical protein
MRNTDPIKLLVLDVRRGRYIGQDKRWACEVTFGIPGTHDNPTITCTSEDVEKYPQPGDVMLVYPPRIAGYASVASMFDPQAEKEGA